MIDGGCYQGPDGKLLHGSGREVYTHKPVEATKASQWVSVGSSAWLDALRESHDRLTLLATSHYLEHGSYPEGWDKLDDTLTNARKHAGERI